MKIIDDTQLKRAIKPSPVLTIGNFDGVHTGHQHILSTVKALAGADRSSVVMTFDPHPMAVLQPERLAGQLTPLKIKADLLESAGIDVLIVIKDSIALLNMSPESFVQDFLMDKIAPSVIVEGCDFNFGYGRSGNVDKLTQMGPDYGFEVKVVPPVKVDIAGQTAICSSSLIRRLLLSGAVEDALKLLDRPYGLIGRVVKGRGKGSELGFPTANITVSQQIIPAEGVYFGYVTIGDETGVKITGKCDNLCNDNRKMAAISIGRAKTFVKDHPLLLEAHILSDDVNDIYNRYIAMEFVGKIRNQRRFDSQNQLKAQIAKDCSKAIELLSRN